MRPRWRFADRRPNDGPRPSLEDLVREAGKCRWHEEDVWARSVTVSPPPGMDVEIWPASLTTVRSAGLSYTLKLHPAQSSGAR